LNRQLVVSLCSAVLVLGLGACRGSGESAAAGEPGAAGSPSGGTKRALALATPAQARWSQLQTLPLVLISLANLPDGKVLM
jgi:hypothetical protein